MTGPDITDEDVADVETFIYAPHQAYRDMHLEQVREALGVLAPRLYARWVAAELRACARSIQRGDLYDERKPVVEFLSTRAAELERQCAEQG